MRVMRRAHVTFLGRRPYRWAALGLAAATGLGGVGAALSSVGPAATIATAASSIPLLEVENATPFQAPPTLAVCKKLGFSCYNPLELETAYRANLLYREGITGTGVTIAIVDSYGSPDIRQDLAVFDQAYHLPAPPEFTIIQPDGPVGTNAGWATETTLDVEAAHTMAPGANILLVETPVAETEGTVGFPQIVAAENYVIEHHLADVISQSFAATEQTFKTAQSLLALRSAYINAFKAHISVLGSAGDDGATSQEDNGSLYPYRVVNWPASDPLVTGLGGTQLFLNQSGAAYRAPRAWSGSGGGRSVIFNRPSYQVVPAAISKVVGTQRGVPDISMSADPNGGFIYYMTFPHMKGGWGVVGGTSEASPLFAGVVALADQVAGHPLGLLNPALYRLAFEHAPGIVPVTSGNNTATFTENGQTITVRGFYAHAGYSLVNGVGTVNAYYLVPELARSTPPSQMPGPATVPALPSGALPAPVPER